MLINITGGLDMTLFEVDEAANRIREEVDPDANIIFGSTFDETLTGKMRISVVATGIDAAEVASRRPVIQLVTENDRVERHVEPEAEEPSRGGCASGRTARWRERRRSNVKPPGAIHSSCRRHRK